MSKMTGRISTFLMTTRPDCLPLMDGSLGKVNIMEMVIVHLRVSNYSKIDIC